MMDFNHERRWAMYLRSNGGWRVMPWYEGDKDTFEHNGVTYTRTGPIVKARERPPVERFQEAST